MSDIKQWNDIKRSHYWCNCTGDLNIPGIIHGELSDLPPTAAALYDQCWAEDAWNAGHCHVMSVDGKFGIAFELEVYPEDFHEYGVPSTVSDTCAAIFFVGRAAKELNAAVKKADEQTAVYFDSEVEDDVDVAARVLVFVPLEGNDIETYKTGRLTNVAKHIADFPFYETISQQCQEKWGSAQVPAVEFIYIVNDNPAARSFAVTTFGEAKIQQLEGFVKDMVEGQDFMCPSVSVTGPYGNRLVLKATAAQPKEG